MATESETRKEGRVWKWLIPILGVVVFFGIVAAWWYVGRWPMALVAKENPSLADFGAYGDMFGFVNSLFSALALFAVIATLWMQMKELKLQREELRKTTAAQARAASAQEEVTEVQKQQIKATLLATYTQGLIAIQQSPPTNELTIPQEVFLERITGMIRGIEAEKTDVKDCITISNPLELTRKRLRQIRRIIQQSSMDSRHGGMVVAKDARSRLEAIKDEFLDDEREYPIYHFILHRLVNLENYDGSVTWKQQADAARQKFDELYDRVKRRLDAEMELAASLNKEKIEQ